MNDLERAIALATETHAGQTDKAGATYIRHPLRVMERMNTETERIAAVLHDVPDALAPAHRRCPRFRV